MKWHPSALGKLMTAPKLKSEQLSETAKSEIRRIAKEQFFGYSSTIVTKPMMKGKDWHRQLDADNKTAHPSSHTSL